MATLDSARAMKQDKVFGTIAAGKRADLVVIDGDPLADITAVRKVVSTMRAGVLYEAQPLLAALSVKP
jgi:imidazolonepropionase-like amidohydrolase